MTENPGFNPGGIADILMGIISGKGTAQAQSEGLIPAALRNIQTVSPDVVTGGATPQGSMEDDITQARDFLAMLMGQSTPTAQQKFQQTVEQGQGAGARAIDMLMQALSSERAVTH